MNEDTRDLCLCRHERAYHDSVRCIAKRDLYQCGCVGFRAAPLQYVAVEQALAGIPIRSLGTRKG